MKKYFVLLALLSSSNLIAQRNASAVLSKGKEIKVTITTNQDIDMGMPIITNSTSVNKVSIVDVTTKDYVAVSQKIKFTLESSAMGQETKYDSDKPEDRSSDVGRELEKTLTDKDSILIDIKTGVGRAISPEKKSESDENANPLAMLGSAGNESDESAIASILFVLPVEAKVGNNWVDSSTEKDMKKSIKYSIEKIENNIVTIKMEGSLKGTASVEIEGQDLNMSMSSKTTGQIQVDKTTNLVKKRDSLSDITGSMEVMGQSMPFKSKTTVTSTYE